MQFRWANPRHINSLSHLHTMLSLLLFTAFSASAQALPGLFGSAPKINKYYCVQNCTGVANGATSKADYSQTSNVDWKSLAIGFIVSTVALTFALLFVFYLYNKSTSSRELIQKISQPNKGLAALTDAMSTTTDDAEETT